MWRKIMEMLMMMVVFAGLGVVVALAAQVDH